MHDYAFRSSVATRLLMSIKREFLVYYENESKFLLNSGKIVLCMCSKWCSIGKIKIMYSLSVSQRISLHWPLFLAVCERSFAQRKTVFVSFDLWLMCCHISYHHIKMDPFFSSDFIDSDALHFTSQNPTFSLVLCKTLKTLPHEC